ncbi:hypothetical protein BDI4_570036 [Burkholderia diffusa]|nr:hypothetical protein BDI4_570036 [Burkholderia diffusa]
MNAPHPEPPRPRKPALKLVKTADLSRDDWLAVRRTGIGGSDAASAVGLNPYMSALELWLDKTGRAEGMPRPRSGRYNIADVLGHAVGAHRCSRLHPADR